MTGARMGRHLGLSYGLTSFAFALLLAAGCGKKPVSTSADPPAVSQAASAGPRTMPAVGADNDQLLPEVPAGYTACTKSVFDPRIDPTAAAERSDAWQAEAAKLRPSLHPVDVRAAVGPPDDDHTLDDERPERMARFTLAQGVVEMRFPGRLSRIRAARRAAQPEYARQPADASDYVLSPLGVKARVLVGEGWIYRGTGPLDPGMEVDVFLVKEGVEETAQTLGQHVEHAIAAITCAIEEGRFQRGAYRVAATTEPDGAAFLELGATAGSLCVPGDRWGELVGVRRVGDVTVVMACKAVSDASRALCKSTLRAVRRR